MAIGAHQSASALTIEWLTPPEIVQALGPFDLDPCSPAMRPWPTATTHYSLPAQNGLALPWSGRVWLNPPYGRLTGRWLQKLIEHGNGIAMIFARTETRMFFEYVWESADAVLFIKGRPIFYRPDGRPGPGNCGAPVCLVAYGTINAQALAESGIDGKLIYLKSQEA